MFKKIGVIFTYVALVLYILLGILLVGSLAPFAGYQVRLVESGSMEPTVPLGSIVFTTQVETYAVGDIITFKRTVNDEVITHRIVELTDNEEQIIYSTQGDANNVSDRYQVLPQEILGKVVWHLPRIGFVVDFVKKPLGFSLIIGVPALLIAFEESQKIWEEIKKRKTTT
jgi:signal peptidase